MAINSSNSMLDRLSELAVANDPIDPKLYEKYDVKRGLRYSDGRAFLLVSLALVM